MQYKRISISRSLMVYRFYLNFTRNGPKRINCQFLHLNLFLNMQFLKKKFIQIQNTVSLYINTEILDPSSPNWHSLLLHLVVYNLVYVPFFCRSPIEKKEIIHLYYSTMISYFVIFIIAIDDTRQLFSTNWHMTFKGTILPRNVK